MPRFKDYIPHGVIPAALLPFNEDYSIDEKSARSHLRDVAGVDGITAVTTNAHSSEVHACTIEEQERVLAVTMDEIGDEVPVINGIYADGSHNAARLAKMATTGGASALLVLPPHSIGHGSGQMRPEMAVSHFKTIADATDLPIIIFQYPFSIGYGYPTDTLLKICDAVPTVTAIKDGCYDAVAHERHIHVLQNLPRPVNVLSTHSPWLMASLTMGCNGLLSGSGSIIADLHVALWRAVQAKDLATAQAVNDRIYPTAQCFYADPRADMHNRMKEALVMLGRLPRAVVRPPLAKITPAELERIKKAITEAGLTREGAAILKAAAE